MVSEQGIALSSMANNNNDGGRDNPRDAGRRDTNADLWAAIEEQRQAMARMEAMIQQLVGVPLAPANRGARNRQREEPPPRVARKDPMLMTVMTNQMKKHQTLGKISYKGKISMSIEYALTYHFFMESYRLRNFWIGSRRLNVFSISLK